jgi:large subunit ribosomal protein L22
MKTYARLRNFGVPALKVRRYGRTIKGEPVVRALAILDLQPSPTCQALGKLLRSAVANAQNNNELSPEVLIVSNITADQGPTMKRIRPRARGRAYRVLKRSCHVTIELDLKPGISTAPEEGKDDEPTPPKRRRRAKPAGEEAVASADQETGRTAEDTSEDKRKPKKPSKRASKAKPKAEDKKDSGASPAKPRARKTVSKPKAGKEDKGSKE